MPLSGSLTERLSEQLSKHLGVHVDIERAGPVGGGSINNAYRLDTNAGRFFVKMNSADRFPSMFEAEADGLRRLRDANTVRVPEVIGFGEDHDDSYLLLEHIEGALRTPLFWERFGRALAQLHRNTSSRCGLERNNYIGSLPQVNKEHPDWPSFFIQERLEPQVRLARDKRRIGMGEVLRFERLYAELSALFPQEPPALLHGDLWSGNFLCDVTGHAVLIDPAVYYGHREMDIAMMKLFGGSEAAFYSAYHAERPLERGWEERVDLCNLYPLLVHVNLFGGNYVQQVDAILKRFT